MQESHCCSPEIATEIEDIFTEFALNLRERFDKGQYTHEGKLDRWISVIWKRYFFPEMQQQAYDYINQTRWANNTNPEDSSYVHQGNCVNIANFTSDGLDVDVESINDSRSRASRVLRALDDPKSECQRRSKSGSVWRSKREPFEGVEAR